jgi:hypothetical protein
MSPKCVALLACLALHLGSSAVAEVPPEAAVWPTGGPEPDFPRLSDDPLSWSVDRDALERPATRFQKHMATLTEREEGSLWAEPSLNPLGFHFGYSRRKWVYDDATGTHIEQIWRREVVLGVPLVLAMIGAAMGIALLLWDLNQRRHDEYEYYMVV